MRDPAPDPKPRWWILVPPAVFALFSPVLVYPSPRNFGDVALLFVAGFIGGLLITILVWHTYRFVLGLFDARSRRTPKA